jgi:hypothetical protein
MQLGTCDAKKLPGSDSGEDKVGLRELRDFMIDFNPAA